MRIDVSDLVSALGDVEDQVLASLDEQSLRAIGFAGAEVIREEAKRNAQRHVQTGTLWRSIIAKRLEEKSDGATCQAYLVTVRQGRYGGDDAFYARFVERGHKFVPRKKQGTSWKAHRRAAELEYGTSSAPAYPFMRPAYMSKREASIDAMSKKLAEQLQRNATLNGRRR
jgi:HK97 gp10 family phage protein